MNPEGSSNYLSNYLSSPIDDSICIFNDNSKAEDESLDLNDRIVFDFNVQSDRNEEQKKRRKSDSRPFEITAGAKEKQKGDKPNYKFIATKRQRKSWAKELNQEEKEKKIQRRKKRNAANAKKWRDRKRKDVEELKSDVIELRKRRALLNSLNSNQPNLNLFLFETIPDKLEFIKTKLYKNIPLNDKSFLSHFEKVEMKINSEPSLSFNDMVIKLYIDQVKDLFKGWDELVELKQRRDK